MYKYKVMYYRNGKCAAHGVVYANSNSEALDVADYLMQAAHSNFDYDLIRISEDIIGSVFL